MSEAERIYTTTFEKFKDIAIGQQQVATLCLHNKIRESFDFFLQVVEELELKGDQNNQYTNWCLENFVAFKGKRNELSETQKRTLALAILLTKKSATIKQELCPPRAVESPFQVRYTRQVSNQPIVQLYCFNTNGLLTFALATQDGFVRIYNEAPQLEMKMNTRVHTNNICFLGSLKGSNNLLISASTDGVIALWNATSCNFYTNFCVSDHVSQMTTLPNDKIAIINKHAEMEIWCTLQKTLIEKFHSHSKSLASFSDGMILSVIDQPNIITASYILSNISSSRYFLAHAPVTLFATHSSGFFASATADHVIRK